jgi:adenylate cyclase
MKWLYSGWAVAITIVLLAALRVADPIPLQSLRSQTFDYYQQLDEVKQSNEVVVINIGERSLQQWGQWPWPRQNFAQLISDLRNKNAGMIGFNFMFPEPDRFQGDEVLASWMNQNGIVLSQTPSARGVRSSGPHIGTATIGPSNPTNFLLKWPNLVTNIPQLEQTADGIGVIASAPQPDNQTRTYPLAITVGDSIYPSFAIEMLRTYTQKPSYMLKTSEIGVQEFAVPPFEPIVTQPDGTAYIRFNNTFEEYEYVDINSLPDLGGKFIIVGVSAEGVSNPVPTPKGNILPQQIQASMLQNFIDGSNITRNELSSLVELLCALLSMVLIAIAIYKLPIWAGLVTTVTIIGGIVYYSVYSYNANLVLFDATFPALSAFLIFTQSSFNNFWIQFKLREQIKKQFEHYLAPAMVKKLQKNPELLQLGGETKTMTYLFSDIRGFTPISEQFKTDPQGLGKLINKYMTPMTDLVLQNNGTVDKYIGDALMAIWGAPLDIEDHAQQAVDTAMAMEPALAKLNKELKQDGLMELSIGIGINTGDAVVGNMGSDQRFDYSVLGDSVNLAARLEAQTKEYGVFFMFTEHTLKQINRAETCVMLDKIAVKGQTDPVKIYTILNDHKYFRTVERMVDAYQDREWSTCAHQIQVLREHGWNDTLADLYAERITRPMPEGKWDGVDRKTSK